MQSPPLPMNSPAILNLLHFCFTILENKGEHLIFSEKGHASHVTWKYSNQNCFTGTKLSIKFDNIKDPVKKSHQHELVYYAPCPEPGCVDYTGGTGWEVNKKVIDHNRGDKKSHLYKHSQERNHLCIALRLLALRLLVAIFKIKCKKTCRVTLD